jgi:hypothetical protein
MNFKQLKLQNKTKQKETVEKIKRGKFISRKKNFHLMTDEERSYYIYKYTNSYGDIVFSFMNWKLKNLSKTYREHHIAYCSFFNQTPYEKIENKCRPDNKPNFALIEKIKERWSSELDEETLRDCA